MTTRSTDIARPFEAGVEPVFNDFPVVDNDILYMGSLIGDNTAGYAEPFATAGSIPWGFADAKADNTVTGHAAGFIRVRLRTKGVVQLTVTGASAVTDKGRWVFATDDNTFTLSAGGTPIGRVRR